VDLATIIKGTNLLQNLNHPQQMSPAIFDIYQQLQGALRENLRYRPPCQGLQTDSVWLEAVLAERQPAVVVQVDLAVDMDYKVAVAETGIHPEDAQYRQADTMLVDTARVRIPCAYHEKGDRTEDWRMMGSFPRSLMGRGPASH
jgi:hypothetical protein